MCVLYSCTSAVQQQQQQQQKRSVVNAEGLVQSGSGGASVAVETTSGSGMRAAAACPLSVSAGDRMYIKFHQLVNRTLVIVIVVFRLEIGEKCWNKKLGLGGGM